MKGAHLRHSACAAQGEGAFTGCGKTPSLRLCNWARLLACPERSRRMPIKPIKSMVFSPCWLLFSEKSSLWEGQRPPHALLLESELNWPRRAFRRHSNLNPKLIASLDRQRTGRMLGNVKIDGLVDPHRLAG